MKNKIISIVAIATMAAVLGACSGGGNSPTAGSSSSSSNKQSSSSEKEAEQPASGTQEPVNENANAQRSVECEQETFEGAVEYLKIHKDEVLYLNYENAAYSAGDRNKELEYKGDIDAIDSKLSADKCKTLRILREDKEGAVLDVTVYTDEKSLMIDKIISCEYCADGREITEYYFNQGEIVYAYAYRNDVYGTVYMDGKLPGKRCYFDSDVMTECVLNDQDVNYKNVSYVLKDYEKYDEFTKTQYDQLELDMIKSAYSLYDCVKAVPGFAKIYGYVGDEFGGMLANVHMTISSKKHEYSENFDTNGDGYFEVLVPVNQEDDYGIVCKYGEFNDSTVDDIDIKPGTVEYSLGHIYMAEPGNNVHDANTYLLNANYSSPKKISKGEYCITFTYEDMNVDLKPYTMNLKSGKLESDSMQVIKPKDGETYKYYVTDQRGGKSGNPMTYEMTSSNALVRVYDCNGLVASYQAPVGKAGTVWEVCEITEDHIRPINNCFYLNIAAPFFE